MTIEVVYVVPLNAGDRYWDYAFRFAQCYFKFQPGMDHSTTIVANGCSADNDFFALFRATFPNCRILEHDNSGFDIGAFQHAARESNADLMVFFGTSAYLKREGWLKRMVEAYERHGDHLYGSMGNLGNIAFGVYPHIRTTGFWLSRILMLRYPWLVNTPGARYPFEHGPNCLTQWVRNDGKKTFVCDWTTEYPHPRWDSVPNGFHRGDQSNILSGDRVSEPPYFWCP